MLVQALIRAAPGGATNKSLGTIRLDSDAVDRHRDSELGIDDTCMMSL